MKFHRGMRLFVVICICLGFLAATTQAIDNTTEMAIRHQLDRLLKSEYDGITDVRNEKDVVSYSPDYKMLIDENLYGAAIQLSSDPLIIVGSFTIETVKSCDDIAIATVLFKRLAHTKSAGLPGRSIIPDFIERDSVEYILRKKGASWVVYNPPLPRISKKTMMEYYKTAIAQMANPYNDKRSSEEQKRVYDGMKDSQRIIEKLRE